MTLEMILGGAVFLLLALFLMPQWWSSSIGWDKYIQKPRDDRSKPEK